MANCWGEGETVDEGFTWDDTEWWNHLSALAVRAAGGGGGDAAR